MIFREIHARSRFMIVFSCVIFLSLTLEHNVLVSDMLSHFLEARFSSSGQEILPCTNSKTEQELTKRL